MIVCPNCNHQNPDGSVQCENCYTPLPATTSCPNCGASVQIDATFCGQCGFNLQAENLTPPTNVLETMIGSPEMSHDAPTVEEIPNLPPEETVTPTMSSPMKSPWDEEEESEDLTMAQSSKLKEDDFTFEAPPENTEELESFPDLDLESLPDINTPELEISQESDTETNLEPMPWEIAESEVSSESRESWEETPSTSGVEMLPEEELSSPESLSPPPEPEPVSSLSGETPSSPPDPIEDTDTSQPAVPPPPSFVSSSSVPAGASEITGRSAFRGDLKSGILQADSGSANLPLETTPTQLQIQTACLLHTQTNTSLEIPQNLDVVHIGKPNSQIPPDIDVAGFPNSEVVSRIHADIRIEGDAYFIEDVGSSNGTYINHAPLIKGNRHRLRAGDRISLGKGDLVTFIFQIN